MHTDNFEEQFWQEKLMEIQQKKPDFKFHQLPLARIKKVMKTDQDVKMISAEAPILFSKGCDLFITELTLRAWEHAVENKRRTLQKSDIVAALAKSDMFDFLIDIVPREETMTNKQTLQHNHHANLGGYGNYGYVLPPGTQFVMNDSDKALHHQNQQQQHQYQQHHHYQQQQQQQQQQFYMQQQLLNQQMCDTRQQPN